MPTTPFLDMLAKALPPGSKPADSSVISMLQEMPADLWNGYNLAETPEGKAGALELMQQWIRYFGLALI